MIRGFGFAPRFLHPSGIEFQKQCSLTRYSSFDTFLAEFTPVGSSVSAMILFPPYPVGIAPIDIWGWISSGVEAAKLNRSMTFAGRSMDIT